MLVVASYSGKEGCVKLIWKVNHILLHEASRGEASSLSPFQRAFPK